MGGSVQSTSGSQSMAADRRRKYLTLPHPPLGYCLLLNRTEDKDEEPVAPCSAQGSSVWYLLGNLGNILTITKGLSSSFRLNVSQHPNVALRPQSAFTFSLFPCSEIVLLLSS